MGLYFATTLLIPPVLTALYYYVFIVRGRDEDMRTAQGVMAYLSWGAVIPVILLVVQAIIEAGLLDLSTRRTWTAVLISLYAVEALASLIFLVVLPIKRKTHSGKSR